MVLWVVQPGLSPLAEPTRSWAEPEAKAEAAPEPEAEPEPESEAGARSTRAQEVPAQGARPARRVRGAAGAGRGRASDGPTAQGRAPQWLGAGARRTGPPGPVGRPREASAGVEPRSTGARRADC